MNSVQAILGILASLLVVQTTFTVGELSSQEMAGTMHEHLTGVACDDVPPGQERPEFGCFNIATETAYGFSNHKCTGIFGRSRTAAPQKQPRAQLGSWLKKTVECG